MGHVHTEVQVAAISGPKPTFSGPIRVLVDSGATFTTLPGTMLRKARVPRLRTITLKLANGRKVRRWIGPALICLNGTTLAGEVIFGTKKDSALLGVLTLEAAGLWIDPRGRRLVSTPILQ